MVMAAPPGRTRAKSTKPAFVGRALARSRLFGGPLGLEVYRRHEKGRNPGLLKSQALQTYLCAWQVAQLQLWPGQWNGRKGLPGHHPNGQIDHLVIGAALVADSPDAGRWPPGDHVGKPSLDSRGKPGVINHTPDLNRELRPPGVRLRNPKMGRSPTVQNQAVPEMERAGHVIRLVSSKPAADQPAAAPGQVPGSSVP